MRMYMRMRYQFFKYIRCQGCSHSFQGQTTDALAVKEQPNTYCLFLKHASTTAHVQKLGNTIFFTIQLGNPLNK